MPNMARTPVQSMNTLESLEDQLSDKLTDFSLLDITSMDSVDEISQISRDLKTTYEKYKSTVCNLVQRKRRIGATLESQDLINSLKDKKVEYNNLIHQIREKKELLGLDDDISLHSTIISNAPELQHATTLSTSALEDQQNSQTRADRSMFIEAEVPPTLTEGNNALVPPNSSQPQSEIIHPPKTIPSVRSRLSTILKSSKSSIFTPQASSQDKASDFVKRHFLRVDNQLESKGGEQTNSHIKFPIYVGIPN